jgi:hypothetical protein
MPQLEGVLMSKRFNMTVTVDEEGFSVKLDEEIREALAMLIRPKAVESAHRLALPNALHQGGELPISERDLYKQKRPHGHHQIVAVLAFALRESGVSEFTADDMRRAYIRAGVRPPKVMAQALRDAKNKYELVELGSKKSAFRLSPHGERTVLFDLPAEAHAKDDNDH